MANRPDIVLIMTDQQRFDQVGFASHGHFETPNIDQLAARGVTFERAYSASTVCVPSRVALLTGLQPHRVPTQENRFALREGFWTVAHELKRAGYETALFGKMHFAPVHAQHGFDTMRLCEHLNAQGLGPLSKARGDEFDDYHDWLLAHGLPDWRLDGSKGPFSHAADVHPTGWIEREVSEFLDRRDSTKPLFLVVSFPHPHAPYNPPVPYRDMYAARDSQLPGRGFEVNNGLPFTFQLALQQAKSREAAADDAKLGAFLATVRGLIKHIDDAVGRVLERIDPTSTLVWFTSDHGDYAGHRGLLRKVPWIPFDDLARVPLVVAAPDGAGPRRVPNLVQSSDFALTCLDYAGVAAPAGIDFDSRSLRPFLCDRATPDDAERNVFSATTMGWPMVRQGRFKFILNESTQAKVLFDLEADPGEEVNLRREPEYQEHVEALSACLRAALERPPVDASSAVIASEH